MGATLQDFSAQALITAIEANRFEYSTTVYGGWPKAELHDGTDMLSYVTSVPFPVFNNIHRAQLAADHLDASIEDALTPFRTRGVPMFWWTGPSTQPADLGAYLEAHGLKHAEDYPGMAADLHALHETQHAPFGLSIERVADVSGLETWGNVVVASFGLPQFVADPGIDVFRAAGLGADSSVHHYVGFLAGEPVATSTLFLGAGVAGIYNVASLPKVRRQGIGAAITRWALQEARALGYRIGILHASALGQSVYHQLGFEEYCRLSCYLWTAPTS